MLANPTKEGYTFDGWYTEHEFTNRVTSIVNGTEGNVDLYAKWSLTPYTISYNLEDGVNDSSNPAGYNLSQLPITLVAPTKTGYTFKGWTGSNGDTPETELTIQANTTGNLSYTANWELNSYTINYNLNGGAAENLVTGYDATMLPLTLGTPTKANYDFAGWYETEDFSDTAVDTISTSNIGNKTLYAKWTGKQYNITYHLDGGENNANNPATYAFNGGNVTLLEPTKDGYSFEGWYETSDFSGSPVTQINAGTTGNKTFYAKWNLETYTIAYELDGGTNNISNPNGYDTTTLPITLYEPTKAGATFAGWYETSNFSGSPVTQINAGTTGNKTFYAKWNLETYTIAYELDGGTTTNPTSYTVDNLPLILNNPTKDGYTFLGWYETLDFSGSPVTQIDAGTTGNKTFYAKWAVNSYTYNIVYKSSSGKQIGSETATYEYGTTNVINPKEFTGYSTPEPQNVAWDSAKKTITFIYTPITYTVNWELNGGNLNDQSVSYNIETPDYTLPIPTKAGYAFAGWFTTSDLSGTTVTKLATGTTGDKMFYAKWDADNLNNVTLKYLNDVTADLNVTVSSVDALPIPSRTGYTFNGWHTASEGIGNDLLEQSDFISDSTYKWTYNSSTGEWESTGNKGKNNSVSVLRTVEFNAKSGEQLSFEWRSDAESSYDYAAWNIWDVNNSQWLSGASTWGTSHNDSTSGLTPTSGIATTSEKQSSSTYTTNTYTFANDGTYQIYWTYRKDRSSDSGTDLAYVRNVNVPGQTVTIMSETPVNELSNGLTLYAKWSMNEYSISWVLNEGTLSNQKNSYNVKTNYTLPTPTRVNYMFDGWYETADFSDSKVTNIAAGTTGNKTFYGKWYDNYNITYVLNDGSNNSSNPSYYSSGRSYSLYNPTRTDYVFEGWYETENFSGSKITSISTGSSGDKTFYAKWYDNYNITYILNDGTLPGSAKTVYSNGSSYTLPTPTRTDYVFEGWYETENFSSSKVTGIAKGTTGDKTFYGKWYDNYNITYVLNDGTNNSSNPSYYSSGRSYSLYNPTRTGYVFAGWYETADFSGSKVTSISKGSTGDKTFYAKWYDNYTITYILNDGYLPDDAKAVYSSGSSYTLPTPTRTGYVFAGWYETADFSGSKVTSISKGSTGDKTFYGKWYDNYNITYVLNDGTLPNDAKTIYSSGSSYKLPIPTKDGYAFNGWYETEDFSGTRIVSIFKGSTGNKTFYAKWADATYELKTGLAFNKLIPSTTTSVVFTDEVMPADATVIDVDADGDGGVVGWLDGTTFKVSTQKPGQKIIFNEDSSYMFCGDSSRGSKTAVAQNLTSITGLENLDTSSVTNMSYMFYDAGINAASWSFGDLSGWDTSSVTNMSYMFYDAGKNATTFNLDLSGWNTSSVTNMSGMFYRASWNARTFNLDLSGWDTSSVTNMSYMFSTTGRNATTWSIEGLSGWDTSSVTNMSEMFSYVRRYADTTFNLDLSGWNTSSVIDMSGMFYYAGENVTTFNLDLSDWNTSSVTSMQAMFSQAGKNATSWSIGDISGWNTSKAKNVSAMFSYAGYNASYSLNLSSWNVNKVTSRGNFNVGVADKIIAPKWVK